MGVSGRPENQYEPVSSSSSNIWQSLKNPKGRPPGDQQERRKGARVATNLRAILRLEETGTKPHSLTASVTEYIRRRYAACLLSGFPRPSNDLSSPQVDTRAESDRSTL